MKIRKVGIVGVGLMGASFALALKNTFPHVFIAGYARSKKSLQKLKKFPPLDFVSTDLEKVVGDVDLVVLALPVEVIVEYLKIISPLLKKGSIVIDLGSTKENICVAAKKFLPSRVKFVGCHPLCGSEKSGVKYARGDLYKGSLCIVTSRGKAAQDISKLWHRLGADVKYLSPAKHDKILGDISHLTHVIAFAMAAFMPSEYLKFSIPSLRSIMRLAASSPYVWRDIFMSNRRNLMSSIRRYIKVMDMFLKAIEHKDREKLVKLIARVNAKYKSIKS